MPPTLILIRHAQALHNEYSIPDPELSELGRSQCLDLRKSLLARLPGKPVVGLIVVSPMRRTIETALRSLDWLIESGVPIQAHADWQENSSLPCDTGSSLAALKAEFPQVDFSHVDPVYPDKTSPAGARYRHTRAAILARAQSCLADLRARPEKAVAVVTHSGFLRQGLTGSSFFNADYRIYDFAEGTAITQHNETLFGGLGWSEGGVVGVGDDLPEEDPNAKQAS